MQRLVLSLALKNNEYGKNRNYWAAVWSLQIMKFRSQDVGQCGYRFLLILLRDSYETLVYNEPNISPNKDIMAL